MLNYILKCIVFMTFFNLAISDPVGQNCQVPEKVGNMIPVLVECLGTLIASGFRFMISQALLGHLSCSISMMNKLQ